MFHLIFSLIQFLTTEKRNDWYFGESSNPCGYKSLYLPSKYSEEPDLEFQFYYSGEWKILGEFDCTGEWFRILEGHMDKINELVVNNNWALDISPVTKPSKKSIEAAKTRAKKLVELSLHLSPQYHSFCQEWGAIPPEEEYY